MLTIAQLKSMPIGTVFATGVVFERRLYAGGEVRWIAKRGRIHDWTIYYHFSGYSIEYIAAVGDKCFTKELIRELVPCDDEAFAMYRF